MEQLSNTNRPWSENHGWQNNCNAIGAFAVIGLAFAIPISTAATNILMLVIVSCFFLGGQWQRKRQKLCAHPLVWFVLAFFGLFVLGVTWSVGTTEQILHGLSDQSKLLYFPILLWFLKEDVTAKGVVWAIVLAMGLTYSLGFLKYYFELPIGLKYSEAAVFKNHIKTNFFMAFATFFALGLSVQSTRWRPYLFVLIACFFHYGYFMSIGRTGYVLMVLLVALFSFQHFRWKGLLVALFFLGSLVALSWTWSHTFHERVAHMSCEFASNPQDLPECAQSEVVLSSSPTSIEYRKDFIVTAWHAIGKRFWFGYGTGGFTNAYQSAATELSTLMTNNPHNEYLHIWVELGVVGLAAFLLFFGLQFSLLRYYDASTRPIAEAVLVGFMVGCLANSWLLDFSEIHFWMLLLALGSRKYRDNM